MLQESKALNKKSYHGKNVLCIQGKAVESMNVSNVLLEFTKRLTDLESSMMNLLFAPNGKRLDVQALILTRKK